MNLKIYRWYLQHDPSHPAKRKGTDKSQKPKHGGSECNPTLVHSHDRIKNNNSSRDRDDHSHNSKECIDVSTCSHGKEVVEPNQHREKSHCDQTCHGPAIPK